MIQMSLTAAGLAAVTRNSALVFTRFVAGSGTSDQESIATACQDVPISSSQTYIAGQSYTVNGQQMTVDYNAVDVTGMLSTVQAQAAYSWTELALMAREGAGEEFTFAYGCTVNNAFYIDPDEAVTYVIPFSVIFSDAPNVTVTTTETGVPWATFLSHENTSVSTGVHGLHVSNGDLVVNGTALGLASLAEVDARTANVMDYVGMTAYLRSEHSCYRCQYSEIVTVGDYIVEVDGDWQRCDSTTEDALEVIADGSTPGDDEIVLREAQGHFCGWVSMDTIENRLQALESSTSPYVKFKATDEREYNTEWVPRMTGAGTAASPYLIYTPYDFNAIRNDLAAHYVLMNNIDLSAAIGIGMSLSAGGLVYGDVDTTAPLYNEGQGWEPFGTFTGSLNGNGKTIRGLVCSRNAESVGIFAVGRGAVVTNLTIKDSVIVNAKNGSYTATIFGKTETRECSISNVVSYATVYNSSPTGENKIGGLVGETGISTHFTNCCNHGVLDALYWSNAYIGGIVAWGTAGRHVCSYNTANLRGKRASGISDDNSYMENCYNTGTITSLAGDSFSLGHNSQLNAVNCYSLAGCADHVQGTALTADQMQSEETVDLLNKGLQTPVFVVVEGGFPAFDYEVLNERDLAPELHLAVLDASGKDVLPSGVGLGTLLHLPSRADFRELKAETQSKSTVSKLTLALPSADWDNSAQTVTGNGVNINSVLVMIPKSADAFTYGLSISEQGDGTVTVSCASTPSSDVSVDVLVIN